MKNLLKQTACIALLGLILSSCQKDDDSPMPVEGQDVKVTLAAGDSAAVIGKINEFRAIAGNVVNTTPSSPVTGRREINWDGVPADFISPLLFPANFFNATDATAADGRKRGLVYVPANAELLVSDKNFAEVDPVLATQFTPFSKAKLFSAKGTTVTEIKFLLPGTNTPAYVTAFGLIFCDVDNAEATTVDLYEGDKLIGHAKAQAADKKFSFVGLQARAYKITRVKITSGDTAIAAGVEEGVTKDIVVMDDFIYSEPKAL